MAEARSKEGNEVESMEDTESQPNGAKNADNVSLRRRAADPEEIEMTISPIARPVLPNENDLNDHPQSSKPPATARRLSYV